MQDTFTVTSTFGGVAGPSTSVQVTAGAVSAVVGVSGDGQAAVQGAAFGAPLVAQVLDAYGNQVGAGVPVTFTLPAASSTSGSATFPGGASTATVVTGANGTATSPVVTAGQPGGVSATATTPAAASGATYLLSVTASGPAKADVSVSLSAPSQVTPGGAVTAKLTVATTSRDTVDGGRHVAVRFANGPGYGPWPSRQGPPARPTDCTGYGDRVAGLTA